jgi:two-component system nitrogen regulation sensor histidine kinase NtrY
VPATVTSITPKRPTGHDRRAADSQRRRPFRDSPQLILVGIGVLVAVLAAMLVAANRLRFGPELVTEFVLYALIAADLTMLAALAFVLARNLIKLVVEQRRALPFARFRSKLVAVLMVMTVVPAVLVLMVGSELISRSVERWFNEPVDEILSSASQIASDYYRERQLLVADHAKRIANAVGDIDLAKSDVQSLRELLTAEITSQRVRRVAIYRVQPDGSSSVTPVVDVAAPTLPAKFDRASVDRLAAQALSGSADTRSVDRLGPPGDLLHAAAVIRPAWSWPPTTSRASSRRVRGA